MPTDGHPRREDTTERDHARVICDNVGAIQSTTDRVGPGATSGVTQSPRRCPETNVNAAKPKKYVAKSFKDTTIDELQDFFGIRIAMEMLIYKLWAIAAWRLRLCPHDTFANRFATRCSCPHGRNQNARSSFFAI